MSDDTRTMNKLLDALASEELFGAECGYSITEDIDEPPESSTFIEDVLNLDKYQSPFADIEAYVACHRSDSKHESGIDQSIGDTTEEDIHVPSPESLNIPLASPRDSRRHGPELGEFAHSTNGRDAPAEPPLPSRIHFEPGKFRLLADGEMKYFGELTDLWPTPPPSTLGVSPACLHSGGPAGPFVFGEPKARAPEVSTLSPFVDDKDEGEERSKDENLGRGLSEKQTVMAGGKTWWPGMEQGPSEGNNLKRKRGEGESERPRRSIASSARRLRPLPKRALALRDENTRDVIETQYIGVPPPRMSTSRCSSSSPSNNDRASTPGVEDGASQGSPKSTIADTDKADSDIEAEQAEDPVPVAPSQHSAEPTHVVICRWSPSCGTSLSDALKYKDLAKHLREAHHLDTGSWRRVQIMNCPWPGCKAKAFQIGSAPRHLLRVHIKGDVARG